MSVDTKSALSVEMMELASSLRARRSPVFGAFVPEVHHAVASYCPTNSFLVCFGRSVGYDGFEVCRLFAFRDLVWTDEVHGVGSFCGHCFWHVLVPVVLFRWSSRPTRCLLRSCPTVWGIQLICLCQDAWL